MIICCKPHYFVGYYEKAIKEHNREVRLSEAGQDTIGTAIAHRKVGECLCALKKYKEALFHQNLHLEVMKKSSRIVFQSVAQHWIRPAFTFYYSKLLISLVNWFYSVHYCGIVYCVNYCVSCNPLSWNSSFYLCILLKDDFQSILRTLESLFMTSVLFHVRCHKM